MRVGYTLLGLLALTFASPLSDALDEEFADEEYELEVRQTPKKPPVCNEGGVKIIACGGNANADHGYGLLISLVDDIINTIQNSNDSYSVPFPKGARNTNSSISAMIGVQHLTEYLQYYTEGCPTTPIVLLGYSLGAIVTMNTLCGRSHLGSPFSPPLNSSYAQYIIATVVYGDETRIPNQPYDLGTCTTGEGVDARQNPAGCAAFQDNFQSYCDKADPECCMGNNINAHFKYPQKYDSDALDFIVDRYDAYYGSKKQQTRRN